MITKKYGIDFHSKGGALTLDPEEVREVCNENNVWTRTHPDGWKISGKIHEDYYEWVNEFEATHTTFGKVWGNFENEVFADNEEGFNHFYTNHKPQAWDYGDI